MCLGEGGSDNSALRNAGGVKPLECYGALRGGIEGGQNCTFLRYLIFEWPLTGP